MVSDIWIDQGTDQPIDGQTDRQTYPFIEKQAIKMWSVLMTTKFVCCLAGKKRKLQKADNRLTDGPTNHYNNLHVCKYATNTNCK